VVVVSDMSTLPTASVRAFDYTGIEPAIAEKMRQTATSIRSRHRGLIQVAIEIGVELMAVKEQIGHGRFRQWLQAEFPDSERTATNFMRAAEVFGTKTATVADLPPTVVYALAAKTTPAAGRDDIVRRLDGGERLTAGDIKSAITSMKIEVARNARLETAKNWSRARKRRAERQAARFETEKLVREAADAKVEESAKTAADLLRSVCSKELLERVRTLRSESGHFLFELIFLRHLLAEPSSIRSQERSGSAQ
jgi:hypothetical protein